MSVSKEKIIEALQNVIDPDVLIDIWTLGLIYSIEILDDKKVLIIMTFTSVFCPQGPMLVQEVKDKVLSLEGVDSVEVEVTFNPPWEPSEELKAMMGIF